MSKVVEWAGGGVGRWRSWVWQVAGGGVVRRVVEEGEVGGGGGGGVVEGGVPDG